MPCLLNFDWLNILFHLLTVKLDAVFVLQDVILLLMQLFAIKLLQLSLNVLVPPNVWLLSSNGWFAVISLSRFRFRLIFSFIDLTSSRVASMKYRRLFNSFWSILNLLRFFSTIGIFVVKENTLCSLKMIKMEKILKIYGKKIVGKNVY